MHNGPNRAPCIGRHKSWYAKQKLLHRYEWNHIRRLEKHLEKYDKKGRDRQAIEALEKYQGLLRHR